MEWREVEIEPQRKKQRLGCWIALGLLVLGVGAIVAGGMFAAWQAGVLPIPFPGQGEGTPAIAVDAMTVPVEGGMSVVVVVPPHPLMVEEATLYLKDGGRIASSVLPGERRAVVFFTSDEKWARIEIKTPDGVIIQNQRR